MTDSALSRTRGKIMTLRSNYGIPLGDAVTDSQSEAWQVPPCTNEKAVSCNYPSDDMTSWHLAWVVTMPQVTQCYVLHMSAEPKWCLLNWSKGETSIFQFRTTNWFRGYVSSNQIHLIFGIFAQKRGQKCLKMGLKCLGLVWYGLVWLGCDLNWSDLKK